MTISVFGLGYVGCVSLGCLAKLGHSMIGVELAQKKIELINDGKPTIVEKDIGTLISEYGGKGKIYATNDAVHAVLNSEVSIICVGTPNTERGELNLEYIYRCAEQIGDALRLKKSYHVVTIRSTVMPGTNDKVGEIIQMISGKEMGADFSVVSNPEFLREGTAVKDFFNPPVSVLGSNSEKGLQIMKDIYKGIDAEIVEVDVSVAEIIKYVNNSYHALKVTFANEVGNICKKMNIDSHKVMEIFCKDKQLNISEYYFRPGFAYGGSCLPKDLKALQILSKDMGIEASVLSSISLSNEIQKDVAYNLIKETGKKRIGIVGISFKPGTDDLRFSPMLEICERLLKYDYDLMVYDENVRASLLMGANKEYVDEHIPHLETLLVENIDNLIAKCNVIVISQKITGMIELIDKNPDVVFIDLIRMSDRVTKDNYVGICW